MASKIDLHIHTTASEWTMSPEELVGQAKSWIGRFAVTDATTPWPGGLRRVRRCGAGGGGDPWNEISTDHRERTSMCWVTGWMQRAPGPPGSAELGAGGPPPPQ